VSTVVEPLLRWFAFAHLGDKPRAVAEAFFSLASAITRGIPASAERTIALRKLLESRDAALRATAP